MTTAQNITPIEAAHGHDLLRKLYEPFPAEDHEVRELRKTKAGKIQWSVYIRREAITRRLDALLPFEWEFKTNEPRREAEYVACKGSLIIKGMARDNNGAASAKGFDSDGAPVPPDENTEKAAITDCFKRCASSWGIGLYLQSAPDIYTDGYNKGDWDTMRQREREALDKVAKWLMPIPEKEPRRINTAKNAPSNGKDTPPDFTAADIEAALKDASLAWDAYKIEPNTAGHARVAVKDKAHKPAAIEAIAGRGMKVIDNAVKANWFDVMVLVVGQPH